MTILDFRPRGDLVTGVVVGAGVLAAPVVVPWAWSAVRPVLKAILKGGFLLYETGRGVFGDGGEGTHEKKPQKSPVVKRAKERPTVAREPELALVPKSENVKASSAKRVKQTSASRTTKRRPKTVEKPEATE